MAYCRNCGAPISDTAVSCPRCGSQRQIIPATPTSVDTGNGGWGVLGFFFPIVGLILFLVWKETKPKTSKVAGIGALIGVCVNVTLVILYIALMVFLITMM